MRLGIRRITPPQLNAINITPVSQNWNGEDPDGCPEGQKWQLWQHWDAESPGKLTEVLEGLFDLLGGQVEPGVWRHQGSVEPVIVVVAVDRVSPQTVHWQLLLQKTDDLELREVGAVAHIWRGRRGERSQRSREGTVATLSSSGHRHGNQSHMHL